MRSDKRRARLERQRGAGTQGGQASGVATIPWNTCTAMEVVEEEAECGDSKFYAFEARGSGRKARWPVAPLGVKNASYIKDIQRELLDKSIVEGTKKAYESHVNWWRLHRAVNDLPTFSGSKSADQEEALSFLTHMYKESKPGTLHVALSAIARYHTRHGYKNPFKRFPLVKMMKEGHKKEDPGENKKVPINVAILRNIEQRLCEERDKADTREKAYDAHMKLTTIACMFTEMMRSGEALRKGKKPNKHCLKVKDFHFMRKGRRVTGKEIQKADEFVTIFGSHKADQLRKGSSIRVTESDSTLSPLGLLKEAQRMNPEHFENGENYMFTNSCEVVFHRDEICEILKDAAAALGLPRDSVSIVSLRSGGATAMWNAGFSAEEIRRRGRWSSDCWKRYTWEGRGRNKDAVDRMLSSSCSVLAPVEYFMRHN